ncbi:MAG: cupin domain-containing protein [Candidatus Calescibacterium sp.]|nr:cupin domain-containing protein [Candidatus Calescibacterium sp.]MCX7971605.1 cupin domain-containing protein [bacterium]MDW8195813.1 cupin domain-containing protein [Candidatus Calescibacterium sp.]
MNQTQPVKIYKPTPEEIQQAKSWPSWSKEVSVFDWYYSSTEKFYVVEGEVEVTLEDGTKINISAGDMVIFSQGVKCRWNVKKPIFKHYTFI